MVSVKIPSKPTRWFAQDDKARKKLEEYSSVLTKFNSWVDAVVERRNGFYFIKDTKIAF